MIRERSAGRELSAQGGPQGLFIWRVVPNGYPLQRLGNDVARLDHGAEERARDSSDDIISLLRGDDPK